MILRLLEKDPRKRLGYKNDAADIKNHVFFRNIEWDILTMKNYEAIMIPEVKDKFDVSQFSEDFTNQAAKDGPSENGPPPGPNAPRYFRGRQRQLLVLNHIMLIIFFLLFIRILICGSNVSNENSCYSFSNC